MVNYVLNLKWVSILRSSLMRAGISYSIQLVIIFITFWVATAHAQVYLNLNGTDFSFRNTNRTLVTDNGNSGKAPGSVYRYNNVLTIGGVTVYALVRIDSVVNTAAANFTVDDDGTAAERFNPIIGNNASSGGYIRFTFSFWNQANNDTVYCQNFYVTAIDVDGSSSTSKEFLALNEYSSYSLDVNTQITVVNPWRSGFVQFLGRSTSLTGITFDNTASLITRYDDPKHVLSIYAGTTFNSSSSP